MPIVVALNQVAGLADGEILPMVRGRFSELKAGTKKSGQYGDFYIQNGELTGDGVSIPVFMMLENPLPPSWKGREVTIESQDNGKGLGGVCASDNTYKNKTTRQIKVTQAAQISLLDGSHTSAPQNPPAQQPSNGGHQAPTQPAPHSAPRGPAGSPMEVNDVKKSLAQNANLMLLCSVAVEKIIVPAYKQETGKDMDEARKGAMASSLYISAERKGQANLMPTKPLVSASQNPPAQPPPDRGPQGDGVHQDDIPF